MIFLKNLCLVLKDVYEKNKVVFTVSTTMLCVGTTWAGYSVGNLHQSNVENHHQSIEQAMKRNNDRAHIRKTANSGNVSVSTCIAIAVSSLIIGFGLGWRGGKRNTNRKFQGEQLNSPGHIINPRKSHFRSKVNNVSVNNTINLTVGNGPMELSK
ncbi:uncharacterized protein LOC143887743 [Tasmannia lanceolata]|uniref:uncharacterized protein LOC143887743 n=1 Tax=Tasmannia lanceolata TaxID=3420 RepID=UPI004064505D